MKRVNTGIEVSMYEIDKDSAEKILAAMTEDQRSVKESAVRGMVAEMLAGNWGISNDALVKTKSGVWLNGQHRLWAVVRSNKPQSFIVMTIPDATSSKALSIMDCGSIRSIADVAQMLNGIKYAQASAGVARLFMGYERSLLTVQGNYASSNRTAQEKFVSREMILGFIKSNAAAIEYSCSVATLLNTEHGLIGVTGAAFLHYVVSKKYSVKMADQFLNVLFTGRGDGFECVDPFRKALVKNMNSVKKIPSAVKTASIFKAFDCWKNKVVPKCGVVYSSDKFPRV